MQSFSSAKWSVKSTHLKLTTLQTSLDADLMSFDSIRLIGPSPFGHTTLSDFLRFTTNECCIDSHHLIYFILFLFRINEANQFELKCWIDMTFLKIMWTIESQLQNRSVGHHAYWWWGNDSKAQLSSTSSARHSENSILHTEFPEVHSSSAFVTRELWNCLGGEWCPGARPRDQRSGTQVEGDGSDTHIEHWAKKGKKRTEKGHKKGAKFQRPCISASIIILNSASFVLSLVNVGRKVVDSGPGHMALARPGPK